MFIDLKDTVQSLCACLDAYNNYYNYDKKGKLNNNTFF